MMPEAAEAVVSSVRNDASERVRDSPSLSTFVTATPGAFVNTTR